MYLMMDHNEKQYLKLIRIIYYLRLQWIFCVCCRYIVTEQVNDLKNVTNEKEKDADIIADGNLNKIDSNSDGKNQTELTVVTLTPTPDNGIDT